MAPPLHSLGFEGAGLARPLARAGGRYPGSNGGREEEHVAKEDRGFASMDRAKQREIASKGGKAAHQKGTAHEWTSEEARDAGRKGGIASHQRRREQGGAGDSTGDMATDRDRSGEAGASQDEMMRDRNGWPALGISNRPSSPQYGRLNLPA